MNLHMSLFKTQVNDYIADRFMNGYLMEKVFTWYTTWSRSIALERGQISWSGIQERLLKMFQLVDSVQMAQMKL